MESKKLNLTMIMDLYELTMSNGVFGSDPSKIEDCLKVYNRQYRRFDEHEILVMDLCLKDKKSTGAIVSYDGFGILDLQIHTFFCYYAEAETGIGKIRVFNFIY